MSTTAGAPEEHAAGAGAAGTPGTAGAPGTVRITFLFTDVEGSTKLLNAHPDAYRRAVLRHHELLQHAVESNGGTVFETVGDAVYAAFAGPGAAVQAALDGQLALGRETWGETPIKVRMGLHTGEVEPRGTHYFGAPLYRCARLMATAHGGQVVLSAVTAGLVRGELPQSVRLDDLGEHRLKDLVEAERMFQLVHPSLPADFPPLRTVDPRLHNLPAPPSSFVGREREVAQVRRLLAEPRARLVSLTGPGGTGKTRLSVQIARGLLDVFRDGVWLVELAPISDPALVPTAIAQVLHVKEAPDRPLLESLKDYVRGRQLLLVLDNFEQVLEAAPVVAELLAAADELKVLVTSRALLRISGEHDYPVPPLALPDLASLPPPEQLERCEAVRLFVERARAARADFALTAENAVAVAEVCLRLDGLPLAIELAAARLRLMSPAAMLARLQRRLALLTGGPRDLPARQQTLRAAIAWSYDLLSAPDQALFRQLSVFVGGCTLGAVSAVCDASGEVDVLDGLTSLVEKSLLRQEDEPAGEPRFLMLETIREFALERAAAAGEAGTAGPNGAEARYRMLVAVREYASERAAATGETHDLRHRHAAYYCAFAEAAEQQFFGPEHPAAQARLDREHDNLRAALGWALAVGDATLVFRLCAAVWWYWLTHGHLREGRRWVEAALALEGDPGLLRARLLLAAGALANEQGEFAVARPNYEQALAIQRALGDHHGATRSLSGLGNVALNQGRYETARACYAEALAIRQRLGDSRGTAHALLNLGRTALGQRRFAEAVEHLERGLALSRSGQDAQNAAFCLCLLGSVALGQGDYAAARTRLHESLGLARRLGYAQLVVHSLAELARAALAEGDRDGAAALCEEALAQARELGSNRYVAVTSHVRGLIALRQGDSDRAAACVRESLALLRDQGHPGRLAAALVGAAGVAAAQGLPERAVRLAGAARALLAAAGLHLDALELTVFDDVLAAAHRLMSGDAVTAAMAAGEATTPEHAVEYALVD